MLQTESKVKVADNTWAKVAKVIRVLKGSMWRRATIWDKVVVAIKSATPWGIVNKGEVSRAVVVRVAKETRRPDGTYLRFDDNAVALIDKDNNPRGKRIFWPVARELRDKGFYKLSTLAEEII